MLEWDKVMKGLRCCDCDIGGMTCTCECPYFEIQERDGSWACMNRLIVEAIDFAEGQKENAENLRKAADYLLRQNEWIHEHIKKMTERPQRA